MIATLAIALPLNPASKISCSTRRTSGCRFLSMNQSCCHLFLDKQGLYQNLSATPTSVLRCQECVDATISYRPAKGGKQI